MFVVNFSRGVYTALLRLFLDATREAPGCGAQIRDGGKGYFVCWRVHLFVSAGYSILYVLPKEGQAPFGNGRRCFFSPKVAGSTRRGYFK